VEVLGLLVRLTEWHGGSTSLPGSRPTYAQKLMLLVDGQWVGRFWSDRQLVLVVHPEEPPRISMENVFEASS
jgi:hypothetical protein